MADRLEKMIEQPTVFDSDQQLLGSVYAKALLAHGKEIGKLDILVEQLESAVGVIGEVSGFRDLLESPRIAYDAKAQIIDKAFGQKLDGVLVNFLKLVVKKGRIDCARSISAAARKLQHEMAGRVEAVLTSAEIVDETTRQSISDRLSKILGQVVSLQTVVDPSIIGGFTVRVGDTVYDASLANQLAQMRKKAIQRTSDTIREKLDRFISG
jgi:F-type H+-transporting ATPase subunit delta